MTAFAKGLLVHRVTVVCECGKALRVTASLIEGLYCGTCREPLENGMIDPDADLKIYTAAKRAHLKKRELLSAQRVGRTTFACVCGVEYGSDNPPRSPCGCGRILRDGVRLFDIAHQLKKRVVATWPAAVLHSQRRFMFNWQNALKELTPDNAPDLERRLIEAMALLEGWNKK